MRYVNHVTLHFSYLKQVTHSILIAQRILQIFLSICEISIEIKRHNAL